MADPPPRARALERVPIVRAGQAMGLLTVLLVLGAIAPALGHVWQQGSAQARLGFVLIVTHQAASVVGLGLANRARHRHGHHRRRPDEPSTAAFTALWLTALPFVLGLSLTTGLRDRVNPVHIWAPAYWVVPWLVWALSLVPVRHHASVAAGTILTVAAIHLAGLRTVPNPGWRGLLEQLIWVVEPIAIVTLMLGGLAAGIQRRERAVAARRRAEAERDAQRRAAHAARQARLLMHDHLLHALLALASEARVPAQLIADDCRSALAAIDRARAGLELPQWDDGPTEEPTVPAPDELRSSALVPLPALLAGVGMTVVAAPALRQPWVGVATSAVLTLAGAYYIWLAHRRRLRLRDHVAIAAVAAASCVVHVNVLGPHPRLAELWVWWQASALLMVSVFNLRWRASLAVILAWATLQSGLLLNDSRDDGWTLIAPALFTGLGELLVGRFCLGLMRKLEQGREAEDAQRLGASRAATAVRRGISLEEHWSRSVTQTVLPALRGVAAGTLDPHEPSLKRSAKAWADAVRDELALGPHQTVLIAALARLRSDGWQLRASLGGDELDDNGDHPGLATLVELLGLPAWPGQAVTLRWRDDGATAVVIEPSNEQAQRWGAALGAIGGDCFVDEGFARLRLTA